MPFCQLLNLPGILEIVGPSVSRGIDLLDDREGVVHPRQGFLAQAITSAQGWLCANCGIQDLKLLSQEAIRVIVIQVLGRFLCARHCPGIPKATCKAVGVQRGQSTGRSKPQTCGRTSAPSAPVFLFVCLVP